MYKLYNGDCLEIMDKLIDDGVKVNAIICDPPYQTTHASWDSIIPFDKMWDKIHKLTSNNSVVALFGQQPFSSLLVSSNIKEYNHSIYWEKDKCANFILAKYQPRKMIEELMIFSKGGFTYNAKYQCTYNPQMISRKPRKPKTEGKLSSNLLSLNPRPHPATLKSSDDFIADKNYPSNIIYFATEHKDRVHPTQKPIALMEYLIKTYTNEGDTVLDFTMGSGSTGVACINTKRDFIGIELNKKYYDIAETRLKEASSSIFNV